jgi:hypothetical protein
MASKIEQPELSLAEIEILKERIENMNRQEQEIVASVLNTSVMETELHIRSGVMSEAFHEAAVGLRRISKQWIM